MEQVETAAAEPNSFSYSHFPLFSFHLSLSSFLIHYFSFFLFSAKSLCKKLLLRRVVNGFNEASKNKIRRDNKL